VELLLKRRFKGGNQGLSSSDGRELRQTRRLVGDFRNNLEEMF